MKKIYILLMTIMGATAGWSQVTNWIGPNDGSWAVSVNWDNGVPATNTGIARFVLGSPLTVNNVPNGTIGGLIVTGGLNNLILQRTGGGTLAIANGAGAIDLQIDAGNQLTLINNANFVNVTLAAGAIASIAGQLNVNASRTYTTNGTTAIAATTGVINSQGTVSSPAAGNLVFQSGATYIHARDGGAIPTASWNNNSNCNITGVINTMPAIATFNQEFGNFTWNCQSQIPFTFPSVPSLGGELVNIDGNFTISSTGTGSLYLANNANFTTDVAGDYIQTGGTLVIVNASGTGNLSLNGNFNMSGGVLSRNGGTSNFVFNRSGAQTFTKTNGTITGAVNFRIDNDSEVDFGSSVLNGTTATFTLDDDGKIITSHNGGLSSSGSTGSIQVGGTRNYGNDADYEFKGASTGNFSTGGANEVRDLIINNTSGEVGAARNFVVTRALTLTNGYLSPLTNTVIIDYSGTATTTNGAFVNGRLTKRVTTNAVLFTFPVGKVVGGLRTIGITPQDGNNNTFTAEFIRTAAPTAPFATGTGFTRVSGCEYWDLDQDAGTTDVQVTLSWSAGSACNGNGYVTSLADLRVAHLNAGQWRNQGGSALGSPAAGTIISTVAVTSFSPFALASVSGSNPLPVVFANVKAYEKNTGVQIEWSNLTEKDVAEYTVERSVNGRDFSAIGKQLPTSNQDDKASYEAFDAAPNTGANYYRIKAEETTGKIVYSKILSVNPGKTSQGLKLYPNPVSGNQVTVSLSNVKRGQYNLRVVNTTGQDIFKQVINNQSSGLTQTIDLPTSVKPGVYNMIITGDDYRESKMFIVQ